MEIRPSVASSESKFRDFWNAAVSYQASRQLPLWPTYPEESINDEIKAGLHFSVYMPDGVLAGYFSVALSDHQIWEEKEKGDAIYIHRVCVNPEQKGNKLIAAVLSWAYEYTLGIKRKFIRMDTWGDNKRLVNYYVACGFKHIGNRQLGIMPDLPAHYSNANLALFENPVDPAP